MPTTRAEVSSDFLQTLSSYRGFATKFFLRTHKSQMTHAVELQTDQIGHLKIIFDAIKDPIHDMNLIFTPQGIYASRLDNAQVCLVHLNLPAEELRRSGIYECTQKMRVGINLSRWYKVLKTFEHGDTLSLTVDIPSDHLLLIRRNPSRSTTGRYQIKLLDLNQNNLSFQPINYTCTHTMPTADFHKVCRDIQSVEGKDIEISSGPEGLSMGSSGDYADARFLLSRKDVEETTTPDPTFGNSFPLRYINYATKATAAAKEVRLYLAPNKPLTIEYVIECLGILRFIIAPRIPEPENEETPIPQPPPPKRRRLGE